MKTYFLIFFFLLFIGKTIAQNGLISPKGVSFPTYNSGTRPAANSVGTGTVLYNSTDNIHQFSNGSAWLNLTGTTSVPSGTTNQTLRNNGSGWVADGLMQNTGTFVQIGPEFYDNSGILKVNGQNTNAIVGFSNAGYGVYGYTNNNMAINGTRSGVYGYSGTGYGVQGVSNSAVGVSGESTSNVGVFGSSSSGVGVFGYSNNSYGGKFAGRVRLQPGGNGGAGIEFEDGLNIQAGYVGMYGSTEMMIWGYGYVGPIQRWNINTGTICYASTPTICSDIRLKKDFRNLSNSLATIAQLKGYHYYLKNEKNPNLQTGFIAQEIQKIFPELVQTDSDGYLSVDYVGLIPHLVESVKTLKNENEDLKERLLKIEEFLRMTDSKNKIKDSLNAKK